MLLNLVMRCSWTLTISPSVVQLIPKSTFLPFVTGLIEILRRCIWNFFRIEKEHVINSKSFTVIKISPEEVMKKLRKMHRKESFEIDNIEDNIEYTKVTDIKFIDMLKSIPGYNLPRIDRMTIGAAQESFQQSLEESNFGLSRKAGREINRKIFAGMLKNYYQL
jgi:hypothetical protein